MHERYGHQIETLFAGPAKGIFAPGRTDPNGRMRPLHRLGQNVDILIAIEFSGKIDWFVGPRLADDCRALMKTRRSFTAARSELSVFDGLAPFADTEIEPAIG